jgi:hypothetical protein
MSENLAEEVVLGLIASIERRNDPLAQRFAISGILASQRK